MSETFEAVFERGAISAADAISAIYKYATSSSEPSAIVFKRFDAEVEPERLMIQLKQSNQRNFSIQMNGIDIQFGSSAASGIDIFVAKTRGKVDQNWAGLLWKFSTLDALISAWIDDSCYRRWQNESNVEEYARAGIALDKLNMRRREAPPPLDKLYVDCSRNPGYIALRRGYVEAVSAQMWLGQLFWRRSGARREGLSDLAWLRVEDVEAGLTSLSADIQPFSSAEGEEGRRQWALRDRLFPNAHIKALD